MVETEAQGRAGEDLVRRRRRRQRLIPPSSPVLPRSIQCSLVAVAQHPSVSHVVANPEPVHEPSSSEGDEEARVRSRVVSRAREREREAHSSEGARGKSDEEMRKRGKYSRGGGSNKVQLPTRGGGRRTSFPLPLPPPTPPLATWIRFFSPSPYRDPQTPTRAFTCWTWRHARARCGRYGSGLSGRKRGTAWERATHSFFLMAYEFDEPLAALMSSSATVRAETGRGSQRSSPCDDSQPTNRRDMTHGTRRCS